MRWLFHTRRDWVLTVARVAMAAVIWPHGAQKVLGLFGGNGYEATIQGMGKMLPVAVVIAVMAAEFLGGIALLLGLLARVAALGIAIVMLGAVMTVHLQNGFFMNWTGKGTGEGFEYHLLFLALTVVLMVKGAGAFSLDRLIDKAMERASLKHRPVTFSPRGKMSISGR